MKCPECGSEQQTHPIYITIVTIPDISKDVWYCENCYTLWTDYDDAFTILGICLGRELTDEQVLKFWKEADTQNLFCDARTKLRIKFSKDVDFESNKDPRVPWNIEFVKGD